MTNKQELDLKLMGAVQEYRIEMHTSVENGIDVAIEVLQSHKESASPSRPLRTKSEWQESLKRRRNRWSWIPAFGKKARA